MPEEEKLAEYQDALLELLSSGLSQDEVFESLRTDPRFQNYRKYVDEFDPDMVAVACELMGKWSQRTDEI